MQKFSAPKFLSHVTEGLDKETSHMSHASQRTVELEETDYTFTATVDQDVTKMENLMDQWCLDLKRNVMVGFVGIQFVPYMRLIFIGSNIYFIIKVSETNIW